jgi:nitroreductase
MDLYQALQGRRSIRKYKPDPVPAATLAKILDAARIAPSKTHDLLQLAEKAGIETNNRQKDLLDLITTFNISVRYPDYKNSFYIKCTKEYTDARIKEIKELREWLISLIENK